MTEKKELEARLHELYKAPECLAYMQLRLDMAESINRAALNSGDFMSGYIDRFKFCQTYGFAVPCSEMLRTINGYGQIVEVGAGTGHLASLLDDCIATDLKDDQYGFKYGDNVEKLSAIEAVEKYPDRVPLCVWPSYDSSWAYDMVKTFPVGKIFIYIGEGHGGCTADDRFHSFVSDNCYKIAMECIPQWRGIHDWLYIYQVEKQDGP